MTEENNPPKKTPRRIRHKKKPINTHRAEKAKARLSRVGSENIWQTAGYDRADDRVDLRINIAVGSVTIR